MKTLAITALLGLAFASQANAVSTSVSDALGGDASAVSATSLFLTTAFDADDDNGTDFNFSGNAPLMAGGALEAVAGHPNGEYDVSSSSTATEGSVYVLKNIAINAGDTLSFDWTFYTNEPETNAFADAAYFSVLNNLTTMLANAADGVTGDAGLSGYRAATGNTFSHTFSSAGTYDLVFAVVDTDDFTTSSALAVNNIAVTAVPEPRDWMLMLAGIGLVGLMVERSKRRSI